MLQREPHIRIALTPHCNLKCIYCRPGGEGEKPNGCMMTKKEIVSLAKIAYSAGFRHIKFTGGEPLLRKDAIGIIKGVCRNSRFKSRFIVTNGTMLKGKARALKEAGINHVVAHLDAAEPRKYAELTNGKKQDFYNVIEGIRECRRNGLQTTINSVIMKRNTREIEGLTEIAAKYGAKLKLIDLMDIAGNPEFWQKEFVPLREIDSFLKPLSLKVGAEQPIGNIGTTMKSYKTKNGATVITRDATLGTFYDKNCNECCLYPCQDAIYGARVTHDGKLKKCIARNDNLVDILPDLRIGRKDIVRKKMGLFFRAFADSELSRQKWDPSAIKPGKALSKKMNMFLSQVLSEIEKNHQKPDSRLIRKSFEFCVFSHKRQKRFSGEQYWLHPACAALELAKLGADSETIAAEFLHDVLEDTPTTEKKLEELFGKKICLLVKGVTKLNYISRTGREGKAEAQHIQRMMLASAKDFRVLTVKLADKLHNLRTIKFMKKEDQVRIAAQAQQIFVPLAHKLGLHKIMQEMEEICFSILEPEKYSLLQKEITGRRKRQEAEIEELIRTVSKQCKPLAIYTLQKGAYNIFRKIGNGKSLDEIYDYTIVVVLARSQNDCYKCLGGIHCLFQPVARKLKDYIAIPQGNGYKSIHTTVISPMGNPIKIYVRTKEMDELAEKGIIAAKRLDKKAFTAFNTKMAWVRTAFPGSSLPDSERYFLDSFKRDFLGKSVFFFDGKGKIRELPAGSRPLDFSFSTGKKNGLHFEKARVNGKNVPLWYEIGNGDIVEFSAAKKPLVSRQWLAYARSLNAINAINQYLEKNNPKDTVSAKLVSDPTTMKITARNNGGLLFRLAKSLSDSKVNIESLSAELKKERELAIIKITAVFQEKKQLEKAIRKLKKNRNVLRIEAA